MANFKIGDGVRVVGIPSDLPRGDDSLPTVAVFSKCVGRQFVIAGFNEIGWAEIDVQEVTRNKGENIWVEAELLEHLQPR